MQKLVHQPRSLTPKPPCKFLSSVWRVKAETTQEQLASKKHKGRMVVDMDSCQLKLRKLAIGIRKARDTLNELAATALQSRGLCSVMFVNRNGMTQTGNFKSDYLPDLALHSIPRCESLCFT